MSARRLSARIAQDNFFEFVYYLRYYQVVIAYVLREHDLDFSVLSVDLRRLYFVCFDSSVMALLDHWDGLPTRNYRGPLQTTLRNVLISRVNRLSVMARAHIN